MKAINVINGIDLHYARTTKHPYGSYGVQHSFLVEETFLKTLKIAFKEVFANCPLGKPNVITCAGILTHKPGQHGKGKAFDLDAIFWDNHQLVTIDFIHQKELYLGIESFLRKHFGIVLNYYYPNHADHWHLDTSVNVDYHESSKSESLYLQMVLKHIYQQPVIIDGISGPQTRHYTDTMFKRLKLKTPITTKANYLKFLDVTGKVAFKLSESKPSPIVLIENLETVISNLSDASKLKVSEALNSFLNHEETENWLNTIDKQDQLETIINAVIT